MVRRHTLSSVACLLLGVESFRSKTSVQSGQMMVSGVPIMKYESQANEWLVIFKKGVNKTIMNRACGGKCAFGGNPDMGGVRFAMVRGGRVAVEKLIDGNSDSDLMEFAEPDGMAYIIPEIDLDNSDGPSIFSSSWGLERVGVSDKAYNGKGVHVYVQDTGVRVSHGDFGGRASSGADATIGDLRVCYGDRSCAMDRQGHGTHCAGTAVGGSFGIASGARVYSVKTLSDEGSGAMSWQYSGVDWVATQGSRPAVLSMSLGGTGVVDGYKIAVDAAVDAGVTVVVAAGNSDGNSCYFSPAFVPSAITVGATGADNTRAYYSNWGRCNDIMAPGSAITSAVHDADTGSVSLSGTSMACPHVSGGAALLLQENPGLSPAGVLSAMKDKSITNLIADLKWEDPNYFLWVGNSPAPVSPPTPAPPATPPPPSCPRWTRQSEPDEHGDCACKDGLFCSNAGNGVTRNCPSSAGPGGWGGYYFSPTCTTCRCYFEAPWEFPR